MLCIPLGQRVEVAALVEVVEDGLDVRRHDLLALPVQRWPKRWALGLVILHPGFISPWGKFTQPMCHRSSFPRSL